MNNLTKHTNMFLTFWQNIASIHQAPLLREVARNCSGLVTVVAEEEVPLDRLNQGWVVPDFSPAELIVSPTSEERRHLLVRCGQESVHIFSGFQAYPKIYDTFKQSIRLGLPTGVFAEPGRKGGLKGLVRSIRYRLHAVRWGSRLHFLLATGDLGLKYYLSCGFSPFKVFPFAYFVDSAVDLPLDFRRIKKDAPKESIINFLFIGQLKERKGLDILLNALFKLSEKPWTLKIVGLGPEELSLKEMAKRLKIDDRVFWLSTLSNNKVRSMVADADCLILPSRFDGWGAVVNEALMAGTPVVVSDGCGSSDLIRASRVGEVFSSENVGDLKKALNRRIEKGCLTIEERIRIRTWAEETISAAKGTEYLLNIIRFVSSGGKLPRPIPPWRSNLLVS